MALEWITQFYFAEPILIFLKTPIISSITWIDFWSVLHLIAGFLMIFLIGKKNYQLAFGLFVAYEIFEIYLFRYNLAITETVLNMVSDIAIDMFGYWLGNRSKFKGNKLW